MSDQHSRLSCLDWSDIDDDSEWSPTDAIESTRKDTERLAKVNTAARGVSTSEAILSIPVEQKGFNSPTSTCSDTTEHEQVGEPIDPWAFLESQEGGERKETDGTPASSEVAASSSRASSPPYIPPRPVSGVTKTLGEDGESSSPASHVDAEESRNGESEESLLSPVDEEGLHNDEQDERPMSPIDQEIFADWDGSHAEEADDRCKPTSSKFRDDSSSNSSDEETEEERIEREQLQEQYKKQALRRGRIRRDEEERVQRDEEGMTEAQKEKFWALRKKKGHDSKNWRYRALEYPEKPHAHETFQSQMKELHKYIDRKARPKLVEEPAVPAHIDSKLNPNFDRLPQLVLERLTLKKKIIEYDNELQEMNKKLIKAEYERKEIEEQAEEVFVLQRKCFAENEQLEEEKQQMIEKLCDSRKDAEALEKGLEDCHKKRSELSNRVDKIEEDKQGLEQEVEQLKQSLEQSCEARKQTTKRYNDEKEARKEVENKKTELYKQVKEFEIRVFALRQDKDQLAKEKKDREAQLAQLKTEIQYYREALGKSKGVAGSLKSQKASVTVKEEEIEMLRKRYRAADDKLCSVTEKFTELTDADVAPHQQLSSNNQLPEQQPQMNSTVELKNNIMAPRRDSQHPNGDYYSMELEQDETYRLLTKRIEGLKRELASKKVDLKMVKDRLQWTEERQHDLAATQLEEAFETKLWPEIENAIRYNHDIFEICAPPTSPINATFQEIIRRTRQVSHQNVQHVISEREAELRQELRLAQSKVDELNAELEKKRNENRFRNNKPADTRTLDLLTDQLEWSLNVQPSEEDLDVLDVEEYKFDRPPRDEFEYTLLMRYRAIQRYKNRYGGKTFKQACEAQGVHLQYDNNRRLVNITTDALDDFQKQLEEYKERKEQRLKKKALKAEMERERGTKRGRELSEQEKYKDRVEEMMKAAYEARRAEAEADKGRDAMVVRYENAVKTVKA
jgi:hypothetical protein